MLSLGFRNGDVASRPWVWDPEMVVEAGRARRSLHVPETQEKLESNLPTFLWEAAPVPNQSAAFCAGDRNGAGRRTSWSPGCWRNFVSRPPVPRGLVLILNPAPCFPSCVAVSSLSRTLGRPSV